MGGKGSGRPTKEQSIVNSMSFTPELSKPTTGLTLPNRGGDHSAGTTNTPATNISIANKAYVDSVIISDHGALSGLTDDDHTQYILADGTRTLTANWDVGSFNVTAQGLAADSLTTDGIVYVEAGGVLATDADALKYDTANARLEFQGTGGILPTIASGTRCIFNDVGSGGCGLTLLASTARSSDLNFADTDDEDIGRIRYDHSTNAFQFTTNATRQVDLDSSGNIILRGQNEIRFNDSDNSHYVGFKSESTVAANITWTLPDQDGNNLDALSTDGAGNLSWKSVSGISNVVEDLTPQLGGNLDVNENKIVSVSNGHIYISPDGTGTVVLDGLTHPQADGSNGQVLQTNGTGTLSFGDKTTNSYTISGSSNSTAAADRWLAPFGGDVQSNEANARQWQCNKAGTLTAARWAVAVAPGGSSQWTCSVYINGSITALSNTITGSDTSTTDTGSVAVSVGDEIYCLFDETTAGASGTRMSYDITFEPS